MFFVYVLRSLKDGKRYVGMTRDLEQRVEQHNRGREFSTKGRRPFVLVHDLKFETLGEARCREKYFKTAAGRRFLDKQEDSVSTGPVAQLDRATAF